MISTAISAAEINFVSSTAMREPLEELVPELEQASGHKVVVAFYPAATLVIKIRGGVPADLVMTTPDNIETLTKDGKLVAGSRVDFAHSSVGVAVRAGPPKPDIGTAEGLKDALFAAKSVGISKGPSGVYLMKVMDKLGIADQVKAKAVSPALESALARWWPRARPKSACSRSTSFCRWPASTSSASCRRSCRP